MFSTGMHNPSDFGRTLFWRNLGRGVPDGEFAVHMLHTYVDIRLPWWYARLDRNGCCFTNCCAMGLSGKDSKNVQLWERRLLLAVEAAVGALEATEGDAAG